VDIKKQSPAGGQMGCHFVRPSKFLPHSSNLVAFYLGSQLLEAQFTQPAGVKAHIWMSKI